MQSTIIVLVGLPARGKTFIASRLSRYLNWIGYETEIFNAGTYRRKMCQDLAPEVKNDCSFFDPDNKKGVALRNQFVIAAIDDLISWITQSHNQGRASDHRIAVFDATNTTRERRNWVLNKPKTLEENIPGYKCDVFFIESVCDDPETIKRTVEEVKMHGKDYEKETNKEEAFKDFESRIEMYKKVYETMDPKIDEALSFIKIINIGKSYMVNRVASQIQSKIVYYLMNVTVGRGRTIYLSRHGESEYNQLGKLGGDSNLSANGREYAYQLGKWLNKNVILPNFTSNNNVINPEKPKIWCSELVRTQQTTAYISHPVSSWKSLNEIDAGVCEGLTYDQISEQFPDVEEGRLKDKYNYRYPMGESYHDLVHRLEPVIMELEKRDSAVVICHQAVARCILAYFLGETYQQLPYMKVPLHTLIKLKPKPYGCDMKQHKFNISSVDTHRSNSDLKNSETQSSSSNSQEFNQGRRHSVLTFTLESKGLGEVEIIDGERTGCAAENENF